MAENALYFDNLKILGDNIRDESVELIERRIEIYKLPSLGLKGRTLDETGRCFMGSKQRLDLFAQGLVPTACFIEKCRAANSEASQSSSLGLEGVPPKPPKSLTSLWIPSPKCHCQMRLIATRANRGFCGAVSQSENASTRPSRKSISAGAKGQPGVTSWFFSGRSGSPLVRM